MCVDDLKTWTDIFQNIAAIVAVLIAGWWALFRYGAELDWKKSRLAKELNDEWRNHPRVETLLRMIDSDSKDIVQLVTDDKKNPKTYKYSLKNDEIVKALEEIEPSADLDWEERKTYLRRCFDTWFFYMALLHRYCHVSGLIKQADVDFPASYYVRLLAEDTPLLDACVTYIRRHELADEAIEYLRQFGVAIRDK